MDYSGPLPPDTNFAPGFLIPCGILMAVGIGLCVARINSRLRPTFHLHGEDYTIIIATILSFFGYVTNVIAAAHQWGHLSPYVSQENKTVAFKALFVAQLLWILSTALVRISVMLSLLRLSRCAGDAEKIWKWCLWCMVGIQFLSSIGWLILLIFNCHPLRGMWEPVPELTCWAHKYTVNYGWVANSIIIVIDFILAMMPVQLIRTLQRTLREKILISCLMSMGLLATGIAAYKMTLSQLANTGDLLSSTVKLSLWCKLEELVGIIAACVPCLKAQIESLLRRAGVLNAKFSTYISSFSFSETQPISTRELSTQRTEHRNDSRNDSDVGLARFGTRADWESGTTKSAALSSQSREVGP